MLEQFNNLNLIYDNLTPIYTKQTLKIFEEHKLQETNLHHLKNKNLNGVHSANDRRLHGIKI